MSFINLLRVPLAQKKTSFFSLTCHNPMSLTTLSPLQSSFHILLMIPQNFVSCLSLSIHFSFLISSTLPQTLFPLLPPSPKPQIHPYPLVSISIFQFVPSLFQGRKEKVSLKKKNHKTIPQTFPLVSFKQIVC